MSNQDNDNIKSFFQAVKHNNFHLVEELIKVVDINSIDQYECPPIYYAIDQQQWKMAQLLIQNGAKLNDDKDEWDCYARYVVHNIIHNAVTDLNVEELFIDFLLSQPTIHIEQEATYYCRTPILTAAKAGNLRILKHLIAKYQPNIHVKCNYGQDLFYYAINSQDKCTIELIQYIHSLGININISDKHHSKPLTYAIENNLPFEIIQQLIEYGAVLRVNQDDKSKFPNLINVSKRDENDSRLFKLIFSIVIKQFPIDDIPFQELLFHAVRNGDITISKSIVENYRSKLDDHPIKTHQNQSHSTDQENDVFVELGLAGPFGSSYGINPLSVESEQFHDILQLFEYLMENGITKGFFNFKTKYTKYYNYTLLLFLAQQPTTTLRLLQLCVENGADIHAIGYSHYNVLHILCYVQQGTSSEDLITKIDYFISLGVNINAIGKLSTPLHIATKNPIHSTKLVSHLINKHHVNIGLYFKNEYTNKITVPFHYVHTFETVKIFVSKSNIHFKYVDGNTHFLILLDIADNFDIAKYGYDDYESNHLTIPSIDDYYKSVMYLLDECGANVNVINKDGDTPLHIILNSNFQRQPIELIKRIIQLQDTCYLNYRNHNKYDPSTPLELAFNLYCQSGANLQIKSKALQTIQLLLQHNINPILFTLNNHAHAKKQTILHYSIKKQYEYNYLNEDTDADDLESIINCCIDNNHVIPQ